MLVDIAGRLQSRSHCRPGRASTRVKMNKEKFDFDASTHNKIKGYVLGRTCIPYSVAT